MHCTNESIISKKKVFVPSLSEESNCDEIFYKSSKSENYSCDEILLRQPAILKESWGAWYRIFPNQKTDWKASCFCRKQNSRKVSWKDFSREESI